MTGRPETLEAALAWLAEHHCTIEFVGSHRLLVMSRFPPRLSRYVEFDGVYGDIPAAIVSAVGDVWDQINTTKGEA